jgi:small subunit ribosomal protein S6
VREYETTIIVQPEISDEGVGALQERLDGVLESNQSIRLLYDDLGKRRLAYEIQNFQKGRYLMLRFLDEGSGITKIERALRLEDSIIRYLTVQVEEAVDDVEARKAEAAEEERIRAEKAAERAAREAEEAKRQEAEAAEAARLAEEAQAAREAAAAKEASAAAEEASGDDKGSEGSEASDAEDTSTDADAVQAESEDESSKVVEEGSS